MRFFRVNLTYSIRRIRSARGIQGGKNDVIRILYSSIWNVDEPQGT